MNASLTEMYDFFSEIAGNVPEINDFLKSHSKMCELKIMERGYNSPWKVCHERKQIRFEQELLKIPWISNLNQNVK